MKAASKHGVHEWAKLSLDHSERDVHRVINKQKLALPLRIQNVSIRGTLIPWLSPMTWLKYIVERDIWYHFTGLAAPDTRKCEQVWQGYWSRFRTLYPDFAFPEGFDAGHTMACFVHGDEGRTLKKSPLMIMGLQSVLGHGVRNKRRADSGEEADMFNVNFLGSSLVTRLVTNVLPKQWTENFYTEVAELLVENLLEALQTGYTDPMTGTTYKICIVGVKGDWPYLIKSGGLNRHFSKGTKKQGLEWKAAGVCHLCRAGQKHGNLHYPYEEAGFRDPAWLATIPASVPWTSTPPFIRLLPHRTTDPATYFEPDIWHTVHLGIGKSYVASTVILAIATMPRFQGLVLNDKWQAVTRLYTQWCKQNKRTPILSKIGPSTVNYGDATGAQGSWNKAEVTTNMTLFLESLLSEVTDDPLLRQAFSAAKSLNAFFRNLYAASLFLSAAESSYISSLGQAFIRKYCELADECYRQRKPFLYPLFPKIHSLDHLVLRMQQQGELHGFSCNPIATACQMDEDLVGKVSRISRRVNIRTVVKRCFQRYLVLCHAAWKDARII